MQHLYYRGHGPIKLIKETTKSIHGEEIEFLEYDAIISGMKIMFPKKDISKRCRELAGTKEAKLVQRLIQETPSVSDPVLARKNWNQRYRTYQKMIQEGSLSDIASVLQNLKAVAQSKELSFGEKKMKEVCELLINTELELVLNS